MNPVFKPRCIMILCIGCTDANMLTPWCMMPAADLSTHATSKLQLLAVEKLSCHCCYNDSHVAETFHHIMSLLDTDIHLHR